MNRNRIIYAAIAMLGLAIYLPGFWWGAPHASAPDRIQSWGVDDETPLGPLAEMHNILQPKPDRNLGYPLMYSFVVVAGYAPYLVYLWLTSQITNMTGDYPFGLSDPIGSLKMLTYIGHGITVLMGTAVALAAYETGRVIWDRRTGFLAALFAMTQFPMFYYARNGNVDVPVLFFIALATAAFAHCLVNGYTAYRAVFLGAMVGFALATKETAAGAFLAMPFVLLVVHYRNSKVNPLTPIWQSWGFWKPSLAGTAAAILALGIGSGLFIEPTRYFAHLKFITGRLDVISTGTAPIVATYPYTWEGHSQYAAKMGFYLIEMMTLPGLLLAGLGIIRALWRQPKDLLIPLIGLTYLAFMFWSLRAAQMRYLLPLPFALAFISARTVTGVWDETRSTALRYGFATLACGIIGLCLLRGIALTYEMIYDARHEAAAWLDTHTEAGDRIEYFGYTRKLPSIKASVVTGISTEYFGIFKQGPIDNQAAQNILEGWRQRQPKYILMVPDLTSKPGKPYNFSCPPQLADGLLNGSVGYSLAAKFQTPPLFPWLRLPALDYPTINPPIHVFAPVETKSHQE